MSTQTRPSGGSRNQSNKKATATTGGGNDTVTAKKTDHSKTEKEKPHAKQPTAEQIRIAQITEIGSGNEDPKMREKVASLMETTQRSEEEVCCALYECDYDLDRAVIFLFETLPVGAFETSSKKKKKVPGAGNDVAAADGDWSDNNNTASGNNANNNSNDVRDKSRNRRGARDGRGVSDSRGWRGRESRENDRNAVASGGGGGGPNGEQRNGGGQGGPPRRGPGGRDGFRAGGGGSFGAGGSRNARPSGGGNRSGPRGPNRSNFFRSQDTHETVDTWDNTLATAVPETKADDTWGDWDNEEYTGSLADTKVFTPSSVQSQSHTEQLSAPPGLEQQIINKSAQLTDDLVQQYNSTVSNATTAAAVVNNNNASNSNQVQYSVQPNTAAQHLRQALDLPQLPSSSLSAEQSQYFNSLTSQNSTQQQPAPANLVNSYQPVAPVQYASYADQVTAGQQQAQSVGNRSKQRARVPPPSKIPSSAVEMPVDTLNNIGYLDVQFGGLDFGGDESFDALSDKFQATTVVDNSQNVSGSDVAADYQQKSGVQQATALSTAGGLQATQLLSNTDALTNQNDNLTAAAYSQRASTVQPSTQNTLSTASAALEQLTKSEHYTNQSAVNTSSVTNNGNTGAPSYQTYNNKSANVYQQSAPQGYSNTNYANTQVSAGANYQTATNTYSSYNQSSVNSYQQQQSNAANSVNNTSNSASSSSVVANNASGQSLPVGSSTAANNSSSSTNSGYLSNQYPSSQTSSTYPSQPNAYQNNQSVYGNSGLSNNAGYTGNTNTTTSQYSNFSGSKLNKDSTPVTTIYDSTLSSSSQNSAANNSASNTTGNNSNSMSSPSLGLTNTKVTNSTAKSTGSAGVVSNIPMVSQYIQTGMPFYQQPVYSYEDIQMLQQRIPPHVPGYYDMNYQTPTSLGAAGVRDANIGSVAYSTMSDGRFARTDNNSSPVSNVPSTMSQQTGSGGPMLNLPYAYFYGGNMMPGSFQYGTPALYPQQMATANASSGAQFPKPSYNSGYGSTGYDTLSQTTQDYNKSGYASSGGQQSKGQNVTNPPQSGTASDISSSMYGKSHVALNKVNSYEKQSFHSGTPPPFNLPGTQTAGATSGQAYGAQQLYIQAMPAIHNMNMHQQIHQMDGRVYNSSRRDSNSTGQRQQSSNQGKSGTKQGYSPSYWTAQN